MIDYVVVDLETSIKNIGEDAVGSMKSSPFYPDNDVVMGGILYGDDGTTTVFNNIAPPPHSTNTLVVGQNIKFDLLYMYRHNVWRDWSILGKVWDTMVVEYLLTGQVSKFASLDKLSLKYGGTVKDDKIKEYWDSGIDTEDIPKDELRAYLIDDLKNTDIVFKAQYERAQELGMLPLIESQMEALMATTEMEWQGIHFDVQKAVDLADEVEYDLGVIRDKLELEMTSAGIQYPNPSSNEHISLYLFGGTQTYDEKCRLIKGVPVMPASEGMYDIEAFDVYGKTAQKAGQYKTRKISVSKAIEGKLDPTVYSVPAQKSGVWSTSEDVLKNIINSAPVGVGFVTDLFEYRRLNKDLNTYYIGYGKLYWPHDQKIHGTFNHCSTATGRLSSSKPNLQNLSNKK